VFDLLFFIQFRNGAIGLCTGSADFSFSFSSNLEVVGFELEDVEISVESNFGWMVTGAWKPDYLLVFLIVGYEQYCISSAVYLGPHELRKSSLDWSKVSSAILLSVFH